MHSWLCGWRLWSHTGFKKGGVAAACAEQAVGCLHCDSRSPWFAVESQGEELYSGYKDLNPLSILFKE